jgi:tetratricopeptide (TPR) repeat protein
LSQRPAVALAGRLIEWKFGKRRFLNLKNGLSLKKNHITFYIGRLSTGTATLAALWMGAILLPLPLEAAFLDFNPPARAAGMGGNLVADPQGSDSFYFNPAGLGSLDRLNLSARYQALEPGLEEDSLSTSGLTAALPLDSLGTAGFSWDHFGSNNLQQDRWRLDWGRDFPELKNLGRFQMGFSFSYLKQAYTLNSALPGLSGSNFSGEAFSLGAGILYQPFPSLTLGLSADDLSQPNLGVIGVYRFPVAWRWGAAYTLSLSDAGSLILTLSQQDLGAGLETQGGGEWQLPFLGLALRAGADANQGALGIGWSNSFLRLDYAYLFSWGTEPSISSEGLPANYELELTFTGPKPSPAPGPYDWFLSRARNAAQTKNWRGALWYYLEALKIKADDPAVLSEKQDALIHYNQERAAQYFALGQTAQAQGALAEAQRDEDWAAQLDPANAQYQQAVERLKARPPVSTTADPKETDLLSQAFDALAKGERKKAFELLTQGRRLYPDNPWFTRLSQSLSQTVAPAAANPQVDRLLLEADLYAQKGRPDLARQDWNKVMALDPSNSQAQAKLNKSGPGGETKLSPEQSRQAQDLYQKGLQAYLSGDNAEAVKDWQETLKIDPNNLNAQNNLVRAKLEAGGSAP